MSGRDVGERQFDRGNSRDRGRGIAMFDNKSILITGGAGSSGRRYVKTLLEHCLPKRLVVYRFVT